jgi:hypothetical protein
MLSLSLFSPSFFRSLIYSTIYLTGIRATFLWPLINAFLAFFFLSNFSFVALHQTLPKFLLPIASVIAPIKRFGPYKSRSIEHSLIETFTLLHVQLEVVAILPTHCFSTSTCLPVGPIRKIASSPYRSSDDGQITTKHAPIRHCTCPHALVEDYAHGIHAPPTSLALSRVQHMRLGLLPPHQPYAKRSRLPRHHR